MSTPICSIYVLLYTSLFFFFSKPITTAQAQYEGVHEGEHEGELHMSSHVSIPPHSSVYTRSE